MRTHNTGFCGEIKKYQYFSVEKVTLSCGMSKSMLLSPILMRIPFLLSRLIWHRAGSFMIQVTIIITHA